MVRVLIVCLVCVLLIVHHTDAKSALKSVRAHGSKWEKHWERQERASSVPATVGAVVAHKQVVDTDNKWAGPLCILGGALGHLALGTLYCWGNFLSYIPTSLRFLDGADKAGPPDALYVVSLSLVAQAMAMPFGSNLTRKFGPGGAFLFGTWMMAAGTYLASFFTHDLKKFMIFYSLMFGAGSGFAYTAPMSAGWKWLPQSKGLVSGGILTGFGFGGLVFSLIGSSIANPMKVACARVLHTFLFPLACSNILPPSLPPLSPRPLLQFDKDLVTGKFPESVYLNFPSMLRRLGVMYAGVSLVGSLLLRDPPAAGAKAAAASSPSVTPARAPGYTIKQAIKTRQFWTMWTMVVCSATAGLNTASIYKQFAGTEPVLRGDAFQASVGGIAAVFNGCGRLLWGLLSDAIGFKNSFTLLTITQGLFMSTYQYSGKSRLAFTANTCALFFCLAGNLALMPAAVQRVFGPHAGAAIYGVLFSSFAVASTVGSTVTKKLAGTIGWPGVFKTLTAMSLVATTVTQGLTPLPEAFSSV